MRNISLFILAFLFAVSANAQLSGTYTISANSADNPDYSSFSAAASALSAGVSGEVIFQVFPGTYEEYVTINSISGTSSTNRVIFRGMGTDNQQVVITSNAGYTDNSTLKLNGANFVTFENLTITTTSVNKAQLLRFTGSAETEWEYAARGGNLSRGTKYSGSNVITEVAWYDANSEFSTHPVGGKKANELGIFDMSGNVYEWCSTWYSNFGSEASDVNDEIENKYIVVRGGSSFLNEKFSRVSYRYSRTPSTCGGPYGFRLAMTAE